MIQMADVYQESNQWDDAAGMYERVKKMYPNNGMMDYVLYRQAIAFLKSGKIDAALGCFKSLRDGLPIVNISRTLIITWVLSVLRKGIGKRALKRWNFILKI